MLFCFWLNKSIGVVLGFRCSAPMIKIVFGCLHFVAAGPSHRKGGTRRTHNEQLPLFQS